MAEICQILLVTLLLYLFWLPSGGSAQVDSDGNSKGVLARPELVGPPRRPSWVPRRPDEPDYDDPSRTTGKPGGYRPAAFSSGEDHIIKLLTAYMILGCKAASNISVEPTGQGDSFEKDALIIQILSAYFKSDCKGGTSSFSKSPGSSGFSSEEEIIIKVLLAYYTDGCAGAVAAARLSTIKIPAADLVLTHGKGFILRLLLNYFFNGCKGGIEKTVEGIGPNSGDAGRHLQSVVLELFLLIFGVTLTQMKL